MFVKRSVTSNRGRATHLLPLKIPGIRKLAMWAGVGRIRARDFGDREFMR